MSKLGVPANQFLDWVYTYSYLNPKYRVVPKYRMLTKPRIRFYPHTLEPVYYQRVGRIYRSKV